MVETEETAIVRQYLGKDVPAATNTYATSDELESQSQSRYDRRPVGQFILE
jgi:hypothetical protein